MKIGFLLYPTHSVKVDEDSSFWMMLELQRRGHEVVYFESADLYWNKGTAWAQVRKASLDPNKGYLPSPKGSKSLNLRGLDALFIRKEPPFTTEYLHTLQLLEMLKKEVFILNDPAGVALANEKLFVLNFPRHAAATLVTQDWVLALRHVRASKNPTVVKPLNEKGGKNIWLAHPSDRQLPARLKSALKADTPLMLQAFAPVYYHGDKRIVILDGKILGAFLRVPAKGDFRANLSVGGSMHKTTITTSDRKIVKAMTPLLKKLGLHFVGIDVIGRYITEINVTSPAGIPELNLFYNSRPEEKVADFIERQVRRRKSVGHKRFSR